MTKPLENRTILITRARKQWLGLCRMLEQHGARVLALPTIEISPRPQHELDQAIDALNGCDWLIFTSVNAAEIFLDRAQLARPLPKETALPIFPKICAVGSATAEKVKSYGYTVHFVPRIYRAESILEDFLELNNSKLEGLRILIPCSSTARKILPRTLRSQGATVTVISIYDTVIPKSSYGRLAQLLKTDALDMITFTSPSTVKNFLALAEGISGINEYPCAVIGPTTAETANAHALHIVVQPEKATADYLAAAIARYFQEYNSK